MVYHFNFIVTLIVTSLLTVAVLCVAEGYEPDSNYIPNRNLSRFFAKIKSGQPVVVMGGLVRKGQFICS